MVFKIQLYIYVENPKIISHVIGARYRLDVDAAFSELNNDAKINYSLNFSNTSVLNVSYNHTIMMVTIKESWLAMIIARGIGNYLHQV